MKKVIAVITSLLMLSSSLFSCYAANSEEKSVIISEAPVSDYGERSALVKENYALAREAATEGIVLLENNGALPLDRNNTVTLFGIGSKRLIKGGSGSGLIYTKYFASLIDGMKNAEKAGLIRLNDGINALYEEHYAAWLEEYKDLSDIARESKEISELALTDEQVSAARAVSDTAIYTISRVSGEGGDRKAVSGDYYIGDTEAANLAKIDAANFDNFIVIINAGTATDTSFIDDYPSIDALIYAWLPGIEGGNALADIICGEVNPSGKLVDTLAKSFDDYPTSKSFYESNAYVKYSEDIFVGYRYFETFDPNYEKVNYCFGYGMSYTDFELSGDSVSSDGENINVTVTVTNTGSVAGKEVVQVYYSAPQALLGNPAKELAGYVKTSLLAPGKSETVTVSFPISDMASFDDLGKTGHKAAYVLEEGDYAIYIGNSVKNAGERGIKGTYTQDTLEVTEQLTSLMTPKALKTRLLADGTYESLNIQETDTDGSYKLDLSDGDAIVEAEDYHRATEGIESTVVPELDNLKYVSGLTTGKYLEYDVSVTEECELGILLSVSNINSTVAAPFVVYVNGKETNSKADITKTVKSGTTPVFDNFSFSSSVFAAGKNTVRIESKSDDAGSLCIDSVIFETAGERPIISATETTTIEAEDYSAYSDNGDTSLPIGKETAFGEVLVAKISKAGKYLEYNLYCEEQGTYEMLFAYAATRDYTTPLDVLVNGVSQNVTYSMPKTSPEGTSGSNNPTAFYNTSAWMATPFRIKLPQGFVTLRLLANGGCPNLNKFTLTKVFELPEGYSLVSGSENTVVEAEDYAVANSDAEGVNTIAAFTKNGEVILNYLSSNAGGRYLEYKLYFEKGGTYDVTVNCAASGNSATPYTFYANGELIYGEAYTILKTAPDGATESDDIYHTYKDAITLSMAFPEGEVIFKVLCGISVPNLNRFTFAPQRSDTPTEGETVPEGYTEVPGNEVLTVEIENYSRFSENLNFKVLADGNAKGERIGENIHGGDWLEYDLWFNEAGTYLFNMNYAATKAFSNPFVFYANGEEITHDPYVAAKTATSSDWKDTYNYFFVFADMTEPVKLTFPKGAVTFRIYGGGTEGASVPNLNKFTLEKTYDVPAGYALLSPKATTIVEAENYDGVNNDPPSNQGNIATRNRESDLGVTFLEYLSSTTGGRWLEYNLYTATAGKYSLTINYASNASKANPFSFFADGAAIECADYTLAKTSVEGGTTAVEIYFQFKDSSPIELVLPKGKFTFRVLCGTGQMPNLNSMAFTLTEAIETPESTEPEPEVPETDPTLEPDYAEDTSRLISYIDVMNGKETMDDFLKQLTNLDLIRLAGGHPPITGSSSSMGRLRKYDIPEVTTSDGGAGIRISAAYGATCWPCSTLLACTWNVELIERVGEGVGKEAEVLRLDCWLAPGMNIHRNPLCGRNFEYFSEDPLITGNCASRITIGAKKYGLHTVAKHFAVNSKETNRSNSDSRLSERALREIYLKGFEILVKTADPRYIMTSYNLINGVEAAESYDLCTAILREEWGFNGIVMTDWMNNSVHMKEIKAGNNIKKQTGDINGLVRQVRSGEITRDELKANAKVILETLADSMSARFAANPAKVNRDGATYIKANEFSFSNDDNPGIVTTAFTKNGFSYKVGDYYDAGSWNPGLHFTANGGVGMNIAAKVSDGNAVFQDPNVYLEYIVDVEEEGLYSIECFAASNYAAVSVDGSEYKNLQTLNSAKTASFNRTSPLTLELSVGKHSIKVKSALIGYVAISPYYGTLPKNIECKILTGCSTGYRISYTTQGSDKGDYTHFVPDFSTETKIPISDHWNLAVDEAVYKYLVLCYRTNYTGEVSIKAQAGGSTATYDGGTYNFTPDKADTWTTSAIELTSGLTLKQIHLYSFGTNVANVTEDMYFDLLHIGFFKTEADAAEYCKSHAEQPIKGSLVLSRESDVKLYDDISAGYQSTAVITLTKDGKTVSVVKEQESSIVDAGGNASFTFSFDVPDGEYTLTVQKPGYVTYTQSVTVEDGACDISAIYMIPGDITDSMASLYGDGVVDMYDFIRVLRAFAPDASAKLRMFTDIDEDGSVTINDLALLKVSFKNTHS